MSLIAWFVCVVFFAAGWVVCREHTEKKLRAKCASQLRYINKLTADRDQARQRINQLTVEAERYSRQREEEMALKAVVRRKTEENVRKQIYMLGDGYMEVSEFPDTELATQRMELA